jgi:uncharacterized protein YyaL (SSP411 family)
MTTIPEAVALIDAWFDTMRCDDGYTGPVVHWWQNCLLYTGVGLDWRYEGIIHAYLSLYKKTKDARWLNKAKRAGDDLVRGQLERGTYCNSSFELNPYTGGTPHEAAASLGLLALAEQLKLDGDPAWTTYLEIAQRNIHGYSIGLLWDERGSYFRDHTAVDSFVPNKAATLSEALFKLAGLTGDDRYIEVYALPTLGMLLRYQVNSGVLDGAIAQNMLRGRTVDKYFPYYVARCVPALMLAYQHTQEERFATAALSALRFTFAHQTDEGGFAQVVYADGRRNVYQQWVAGAGDILRIARSVSAFQFNFHLGDSWVLRGLQSTGGVKTAVGFGSQVSQRKLGSRPDFRDLLPVCGWADKTFRYLAEQLDDEAVLPSMTVQPVEAECRFRGQKLKYTETETCILLTHPRGNVIYNWEKGTPWAQVSESPTLWK